MERFYIDKLHYDDESDSWISCIKHITKFYNSKPEALEACIYLNIFNHEMKDFYEVKEANRNSEV